MNKIFSDPINNENPITKQVLGVCSALAVTVLVDKAIIRSSSFTIGPLEVFIRKALFFMFSISFKVIQFLYRSPP